MVNPSHWISPCQLFQDHQSNPNNHPTKGKRKRKKKADY
jgi:hypothetical protein